MIRFLTYPGGLEPGRHAAWRRPEVRPTGSPQGDDASPRGNDGSPRKDDGASPREEASAKMEFSAASLRAVRRLVSREASWARLSDDRRADLVLAVDELATNSITHGGGHGRLSVWRADGAIVCEVRDGGYILDPFAGLHPPTPEQLTGRGLWVARRLCDHMHISSSPGRTTVRVQMSTS